MSDNPIVGQGTSLQQWQGSQRLAELPLDVEIVAYCRGPFCLFSEEAYELLHGQGYRVHKLLDGVSEWQAAGMPLDTA